VPIFENREEGRGDLCQRDLAYLYPLTVVLTRFGVVGIKITANKKKRTQCADDNSPKVMVRGWPALLCVVFLEAAPSPKLPPPKKRVVESFDLT
jgi:hypothetical protein